LTGAEAALPAWVEFMKGAVDLRPELGGRAFDQPEGTAVVEIDPNTDSLATGKCPSHERVAILAMQAPTSECFRHNIYFDVRSESPAVENPAITKAETARASQSRSRKAFPGEIAALRDTQVSTDKQGRRVLLNEMRVGR
jgi:membrane carboxypeptidase/penicillin-binding protein